ncbi:MAG TPA: substrate-binding domain-containing protein [Verrucomicrobiota bacterium]|nr:substrate-binding domain-containing protein [Verrucomicrobiota bacterium]HNU50991.1 substrate-binding domain-containing protein [Verrucomicrobiota bacterium]
MKRLYRRWKAAWVLMTVLAGMALGSGARAGERAVVLYCAQDPVYAGPILAEFTRQSGIRVLPVYDSEAVKTVGLANRLLAEQAHPRCDVFWGNEELRTRQLAARGVFRLTNGWAAMGSRSRRLIVNTNSLPLALAPASWLELTNSRWQGRLALAYPLFGTTATHFLALRQHWGPAGWEAWCRALQANRPLLVDGNSIVARLVAKGEAWVGLTDSDDIAVQQREGKPVAALPLTAESLLIPNTVAVIRGAPHPAEAEALYRYLQTEDCVKRLVHVDALESIVARPGQKTLEPDWDVLLSELEPATDRLRSLFLR